MGRDYMTTPAARLEQGADTYAELTGTARDEISTHVTGILSALVRWADAGGVGSPAIRDCPSGVFLTSRRLHHSGKALKTQPPCVGVRYHAPEGSDRSAILGATVAVYGAIGLVFNNEKQRERATLATLALARSLHV